MDELYDFMGPKIGYNVNSLREYFDWSLKEIVGYLEAMERANQVFLQGFKWYKVEKDEI